MSLGIAVYRCRGCGYSFAQSPEPLKEGCPECHHEYVDWINLEQWQEEFNKNI